MSEFKEVFKSIRKLDQHPDYSCWYNSAFFFKIVPVIKKADEDEIHQFENIDAKEFIGIVDSIFKGEDMCFCLACNKELYTTKKLKQHMKEVHNV